MAETAPYEETTVQHRPLAAVRVADLQANLGVDHARVDDTAATLPQGWERVLRTALIDESLATALSTLGHFDVRLGSSPDQTTSATQHHGLGRGALSERHAPLAPRFRTTRSGDLVWAAFGGGTAFAKEAAGGIEPPYGALQAPA